MDAGRDERVTVAEAAERLGISKEAVRKRIARGTLRSDKGPDGTVRVYVPVGGTPGGTVGPTPELVEELRDRLRFVERQLEAERQGHSEARRLLAAALERIPELEAPQSREDASEGSEPRSGTEGPQEAQEEPPRRRSWWREFFGF